MVQIQWTAGFIRRKHADALGTSKASGWGAGRDSSAWGWSPATGERGKSPTDWDFKWENDDNPWRHIYHSYDDIIANIRWYYRRKFRSQTSDNMDRWKAEMERVAEMGRVREEKRRRKRKSQKKEDPGARKGRKVVKHVFFNDLWLRRVEKRLAKAAGAEPAGQMRDEKLHAVVARSTFRSQNVQNTSFSDHFWKLRCRKSARRCGAKHISKSKVQKTEGNGALLDVRQVQKLRKSRWIAAFLMLPSSKTEEVLQNSFVFKLADRRTERERDRSIDR